MSASRIPDQASRADRFEAWLHGHPNFLALCAVVGVWGYRSWQDAMFLLALWMVIEAALANRLRER